MATECTQDSILEFLMKKGGRVRNKELTDHFKVFLTGDKGKSVMRESFKGFVDNIAYVKQENGEKMVCLKKKYLQTEVKRMEKEGEGTFTGSASEQNNALHYSEISFSADVPCAAEENIVAFDVKEDMGNMSETAGDDDSRCMHVSDTAQVGLCMSDIALIEVPNSDIAQKLDVKEEVVQDAEKNMETDVQLNGTEDTSCPIAASCAGKLANEVVHEAVTCRGQALNRRRTSRGSQRSLVASSDEADSLSALAAEVGTPKGSRERVVELMTGSSPQGRRNLVRRSSQGQMAARRRDSLRSDGDSASLHSLAEEECTSVTLDPLEHEWMMCASDGEWESLQRLLVSEPGLIMKKDFVTGFTCLHWAAKQGKHELLVLLVTFAQQHSVPVNVNARSSAGYTPLHLAAMHNHVEVMKLLVGAYDADLEARDYSGKKPSQYLSSGAAGDIRDIIGACEDLDTENADGSAGRWRFSKVLQSNLNPLRLLNHPEEHLAYGQTRPKSLYRKTSIGKMKLNRGKFRTQIVHSTSFRETEEGDGSLKSPVKSRPVSNLFG